MHELNSKLEVKFIYSNDVQMALKSKSIIPCTSQKLSDM